MEQAVQQTIVITSGPLSIISSCQGTIYDYRSYFLRNC